MLTWSNFDILQLPGWKYHNAFINVKFVKYKEFSVEFYI